MKRMENLRTVSFCSGIGGFDLGFCQAGFDLVYANEVDPTRAAAYEANIGCSVDCRPIQAVDEKTLPAFDVLIAGFPIVGLEAKGVEQMPVLSDLFRIISYGRPHTICFEQVTSIEKIKEGGFLKVIQSALESLGYQVNVLKANTVEQVGLGVKQERLFIIGMTDERAFQCLAPALPVVEASPIDWSSKGYQSELDPFHPEVLEKLMEMNLQRNQLYYYKANREVSGYEVMVRPLEVLPSVSLFNDDYYFSNIRPLNSLTGCFIHTDKVFKRFAFAELLELSGFPASFMTSKLKPRKTLEQANPSTIKGFHQQKRAGWTTKGQRLNDLKLSTSPALSYVVANQIRQAIQSNEE